MFTCKYCGTEFLEHTPNCPNCGAPIKISESKVKNEPQSIRKVCIKYEATKNLYLNETIDKKRIATVREQFNIAANEEVIMVYDDTILGNNKVGFAICTGGLYWKNDWSVDTKRNFLTWEAFAERELSLEGYHIKLERGDVIGMAGIGDEEARKQTLNMLREIKTLLQ
ncbi:MAG: hypothetical protein U0V18_16185 [Anaerolineales bacterium]